MKRWTIIPAALALSALVAAPSSAQISIGNQNYALLHQYGSSGLTDMKHLAMGSACAADDRSGWHGNSAGQVSVQGPALEAHATSIAFGQMPGVHRNVIGLSYPISGRETVRVTGTWADGEGGLLGRGVPLSTKLSERDFSGEYARRLSDRLSVGIGLAYLGTHSTYALPGKGVVTEFASHPAHPGGRLGAIYRLTGKLNVGAYLNEYTERVTKTVGGAASTYNMHSTGGRVGLAYYPDEQTTLLLDYEDVTMTGGGTWAGKCALMGGLDHKVGKFSVQCGMYEGRLSGGVGWAGAGWDASLAASARPSEDAPGMGGGAEIGFRLARRFQPPAGSHRLRDARPRGRVSSFAGSPSTLRYISVTVKIRKAGNWARLSEESNMDVDMESSRVRVMHRAVVESVLGPGTRAVVWVQGCEQRCAGCIAPEGWDSRSGELVDVSQLADWILAQPGIEGVTLSGGEPMMQAGPLAALVSRVRSEADLGVICYTGYVFGDPGPGCPGTPLQVTPMVRELLLGVDLLIDGPYVAERHADLLWRGSSNQRLLALSSRYRDMVDELGHCDDRSAGVSVLLDTDGHPQIVGVPPAPGFRRLFEDGMAEQGVWLRAQTVQRDAGATGTDV